MYMTVSTVTVIAHHPTATLKVAMLKPSKAKHDGKPVLCGGRLDLAKKELPIACATREWDEEMGGRGATLVNLQHWATRTDPYAEPRHTTLPKVIEGYSNQVIGHPPITAYYACPDFIFTAQVNGEPWPNDNEAEECFWFDLRKLQIPANPRDDMFGGQHVLILGMWLLEYCAGPSAVKPTEQFANAIQLRTYLRSDKVRKMLGSIMA